MIGNKITIETTDAEFYEFMQFKESVNRAAVVIEMDTIYQNFVDANPIGTQTNRRMIILDRPKAFEEANKKIKKLEEELAEMQIKYNIVKEHRDQLDVHNQILKRKKKNFYGIEISVGK